MHGYDYKFVQATPFTDRYNTWLKVRELGAALRHSYRFVIFTDGDIVFSRPEIPLEYLLSYWNISSSISLALAEDPDAGYNFDSRGRLNQNCGFIIAQNNAKTHEIMKDWLECPDGTRYEDCDHWKNNHYHEQGAFSNHVRYDYGDWIRTLPCDHANGAPEGGQGCTGKYVRHYWVSKDAIKPAVDETFMQSIFGKAHRQFVENLNETFWDHSSGMAQTGDGEA
ncbi:hypothetical protein EV356DRAFT_499146 [Viridothelium virens]|uniref:Uncharacterized protein n=1 Tax=Viridothelium virens TaxID=1048519 RepID=A0A6A6HD56_VIRVR|nr:hypothetical protein EV356DRAFT_499146 [Viridothelium virens]